MISVFYRILISLRTVFWLFAAALGCFVLGSLLIPGNLAFYSGIDDTPLFRWLAENRDILLTSWIYGIVAVLALLAASTVACTVDYLLKRLTRKNFLLKVSPQIMHLGVLFVMLGHLLTASGGFKQDHTVETGAVFPVEAPLFLEMGEIEVMNDEDGFPADWSASLWWTLEGRRVHEAVVSPAHPAFFRGYGVWFSSVNVGDEAVSAVLRTTRDPGAPWALFGALILCAGGFLFLGARTMGRGAAQASTGQGYS